MLYKYKVFGIIQNPLLQQQIGIYGYFDRTQVLGQCVTRNQLINISHMAVLRGQVVWHKLLYDGCPFLGFLTAHNYVCTCLASGAETMNTP